MGKRYLILARQLNDGIWDFEFQSDYFLITLGALIYARTMYQIVTLNCQPIFRDLS